MVPKAFKEIIAENSIILKPATDELRQRFFDWYDVDSNEYDEDDVKHLRENDYYCQRFLAHSLWLDGAINIDKSLDMVKSVFKWRKEIGANHFKDSDFPDEFLNSGEVYPYRKDNKGNATIMLRFCKHVKNPKKMDMYQKFIIHNVEKVERKYDRRKHLTGIVDCKGAGLSNMEFPLVFFMRALTSKLYPLLFEHVIVVNMPSILIAVWKVVKTILPQRLVDLFVFVDSKTIFDYIDIKDLPEDMGGLDKTVYPRKDPMSVSNLPESLLADIKDMDISTH